MALKLKTQPFVHLHNHTEFSVLDAIVKVPGLGEVLKRRGFKAYAITDHGAINGVYGFVESLKAAGVKPIVGCEFYLCRDRFRKGLTESERAEWVGDLKGAAAKEATKKAEAELGGSERYHVVVLAKNAEGWRGIIRATEIAHKEGFYYKPRIDFEILKDLAGDVVVLTACLNGVPGSLFRAGKAAEAEEWVADMAGTFGPDLFLELQPNDIPAQVSLNPFLADLGERLGVRLVATNDVHYLKPEDWETHDALLALRESQGGKTVLVSDQDRFRYTTNQLFLKSRSEMEQSFSIFHPALDPAVWRTALDATLDIADRIEPEVLDRRKGVLPVIQVEDEYGGSPDAKLKALVRDGWTWRKVAAKTKGKEGFIDWIDGEPPKRAPLFKVYYERVAYELNEIVRLGFSRYFLVIWDLVKWARESGIRPGPGRGSVGGSLVAYLLGITSVDSIEHDCPFSRFISPDRIDYPDIDLDFPTDRRDEIRGYLIQKYGSENVAGIVTYGRAKGKMVLKDVARVFGVPWKETEQVTRFVIQRAEGDERVDGTLEDTFNEVHETRGFRARYPTVCNHAIKLEGITRQLGVHAAGVVISDKPLRTLVPVQYQRARGAAEAGDYITGWDKREVEAVGLLKLDILGIDGLAYIQRTIDLVRERQGVKVEPETWAALNDPNVYENFAQGNTELVWQMNQFGCIQLLKKLKPDRFEHLVATTSLIRPGPQNAGITDDYVERRHNRETSPLHPALESCLVKTHGLFVYQEDVIKVCHDIGGFTWAEADRIRKDIGKKKGVDYLRRTYLDRFVAGAAAHGVDETAASKAWNQIAEFGLYGFNRAHATGYSLLSYWTMKLKLDYPLEFMAAALESERDADKRRGYIREARRLGLKVLPPDVNVSSVGFRIDPRDPGTIRAGLADVKGIGEKTVEKIVAGAPYQDAADFVRRSGANKAAAVNLLRVGALDTLTENPRSVEQVVDLIIKNKTRKKPIAIDIPETEPYTITERNAWVWDLVAIPPSIHPAEGAVDWLSLNAQHLTAHKIAEFQELFKNEFPSEQYLFVGAITQSRLFTESGGTVGENRVARIIVEDGSGQMSVKVPSELLSQVTPAAVAVNRVVALVGKSYGEGRLGAWALADLGAIMTTGQPGPGTLGPLILGDPFEGDREYLAARKTLRPFRKLTARGKTAVWILATEQRRTRMGERMITSACLDWTGEIRDVVLWPSDVRAYERFFRPGTGAVLALSSRVERGFSRRFALDTRGGGSPVVDLQKYLEYNRAQDASENQTVEAG